MSSANAYWKWFWRCFAVAALCSGVGAGVAAADAGLSSSIRGSPFIWLSFGVALLTLVTLQYVREARRTDRGVEAAVELTACLQSLYTVAYDLPPVVDGLPAPSYVAAIAKEIVHSIVHVRLLNVHNIPTPLRSDEAYLLDSSTGCPFDRLANLLEARLLSLCVLPTISRGSAASLQASIRASITHLRKSYYLTLKAHPNVVASRRLYPSNKTGNPYPHRFFLLVLIVLHSGTSVLPVLQSNPNLPRGAAVAIAAGLGFLWGAVATYPYLKWHRATGLFHHTTLTPPPVIGRRPPPQAGGVATTASSPPPTQQAADPAKIQSTTSAPLNLRRVPFSHAPPQLPTASQQQRTPPGPQPNSTFAAAAAAAAAAQQRTAFRPIPSAAAGGRSAALQIAQTQAAVVSMDDGEGGGGWQQQRRSQSGGVSSHSFSPPQRSHDPSATAAATVSPASRAADPTPDVAHSHTYSYSSSPARLSAAYLQNVRRVVGRWQAPSHPEFFFVVDPHGGFSTEGEVGRLDEGHDAGGQEVRFTVLLEETVIRFSLGPEAAQAPASLDVVVSDPENGHTGIVEVVRVCTNERQESVARDIRANVSINFEVDAVETAFYPIPPRELAAAAAEAVDNHSFLETPMMVPSHASSAAPATFENGSPTGTSFSEQPSLVAPRNPLRDNPPTTLLPAILRTDDAVVAANGIIAGSGSYVGERLFTPESAAAAAAASKEASAVESDGEQRAYVGGVVDAAGVSPAGSNAEQGGGGGVSLAGLLNEAQFEESLEQLREGSAARVARTRGGPRGRVGGDQDVHYPDYLAGYP